MWLWLPASPFETKLSKQNLERKPVTMSTWPLWFFISFDSETWDGKPFLLALGDFFLRCVTVTKCQLCRGMLRLGRVQLPRNLEKYQWLLVWGEIPRQGSQIKEVGLQLRFLTSRYKHSLPIMAWRDTTFFILLSSMFRAYYSVRQRTRMGRQVCCQ
jgi:hypothetical protein